MTILVTAHMLQRRGFEMGTGRVSLSAKGTEKQHYFIMNAKTFTFPVLARNICWSLSSTDVSICHDNLLATNSSLLWINL